MDIFEEAVMYCICANGETFVAPNYDIGNGWSCPDLVALRPSKKKVYIVEVTASGNLRGLLERVHNRKEQWVSPLKKYLMKHKITESKWSYQILLFVRDDQFKWFQQKTGNHPDVTVLRLEDAVKHWLWDERVRSSDFSFEEHELIKINVSQQ